MQWRFSILPVPKIVDITSFAGRCQDASAFLIEFWHLVLAIDSHLSYNRKNTMRGFAMPNEAAPKILYHFTCKFHLPEIAQRGYLNLTTSNFDLQNLRKHPVVWLTSLSTPENNGLLFDPNIPDEFNKTHIRFTIRKKPYMKQWDKWSAEKGMDEKMKRALIESASAEDTYKSWYVAERIIGMSDVLVIENLVTGEILWQAE
jgi:hypothetical protein